MTEVDYILANFDEHFAWARGKRILLHGSRNYAEAILQRFGEEYGFAGVMSLDPLEGETWNGLPVLREEDLSGGRIDLVILTERVRHEEAAFRAIRRSCRKNNIAIYDMYGLDAQLLHYQACITGAPDLNSALKRCLPYDIISFEVIGTVFPETAEEVKAPYDLFTGLIPALRAKGKEIRFSLRRSFSEEKQIRALKESGFLPDERELIRRSGEDLSFRTLKESEPGKKILYFGSTMGNEFILPRYYGIDSILLDQRTISSFSGYTPDSGAPERISFSPGRRETFLDAIRRHSVISFDIFDTLLIRKILYPRDVFALTERKAAAAGYRAEGFAAARARVEDGSPLCTLDHFYEELADLFSWDPETEDAIKRLELDTERTVTEARCAVLRLLEFALQEGKHVVLTSDMYLPETELRKLLEEKGVRGFEKIFVSCDCRKTKRDGLYTEVAEYAAGMGTVLHIGDDPEADGAAPKIAGIDSMRIPSPLSLAKNSTWSGAVSKASSLMERCLLGTVICRMFADPFQDPNLWELPIAERMDLLGYNVLGPMITGYLCWLMQKLRAGQYDGVLFFARDGWLPFQYYQRISGVLSLPPGYYFLTNRRAAFLCCADDEQQTDRIAEVGKLLGLDMEQILERVYTVAPKQQLPREYGELDAEYIEKHMPLLHEIAERSRRGYRRYAEQLGLRAGGRCAVVDFVALGTTQRYLSQVLPFFMQGFYFANYAPGREEASIEYFLQGENTAFLRNYLDVEAYMSSPDPSLDHISEQGEPVFQAESRSGENLQALAAAWDAAGSFIQKFFESYYCPEDSIQPGLIEEMYAAQTYLGAEMPLMEDWFQTPLKK